MWALDLGWIDSSVLTNQLSVSSDNHLVTHFWLVIGGFNQNSKVGCTIDLVNMYF